MMQVAGQEPKVAVGDVAGTEQEHLLRDGLGSGIHDKKSSRVAAALPAGGVEAIAVRSVGARLFIDVERHQQAQTITP